MPYSCNALLDVFWEGMLGMPCLGRAHVCVWMAACNGQAFAALGACAMKHASAARSSFALAVGAESGVSQAAAAAAIRRRW